MIYLRSSQSLCVCGPNLYSFKVFKSNSSQISFPPRFRSLISCEGHLFRRQRGASLLGGVLPAGGFSIHLNLFEKKCVHIYIYIYSSIHIYLYIHIYAYIQYIRIHSCSLYKYIIKHDYTYTVANIQKNREKIMLHFMR